MRSAPGRHDTGAHGYPETMHHTHVAHEDEVDPQEWSDGLRGVLSFRTLAAEAAEATGLTAGVAVMPVGGWLGSHRHGPPETYYVLEGEGVLTVEGRQQPLTPGTAAYIPGRAEHAVRNTGAGELRVFYVMATGSFDDVRYEFTDVTKDRRGAVG